MEQTLQFDSKDRYLTKDGIIIGIHAIGHAGPYEYELFGLDGSSTFIKSDFEVYEIWGNEYNEDHKMLGRGSFRVHTRDFDQVIKELEEDGWVKREAPKRKDV